MAALMSIQFSEEDCAIALSERQQWTRWLVDPFRRHQRFISGSAEYTVNVAD